MKITTDIFKTVAGMRSDHRSENSLSEHVLILTSVSNMKSMQYEISPSP